MIDSGNVKISKGGISGIKQRDLSSSRVNYSNNFTMNLPITSLKGVNDSLMQPSKVTNISTNISQEENTQRLPRIAEKGKITHLRINSLGGDENLLARTRPISTSFNSSPFRSTRHVRTSVSPYRIGKENTNLKSRKFNSSAYGKSFAPINVQDSNGPTPIEINNSFEQMNGSDKGIRMNPKVIESWINETLADAEHLDVPGVLLKPEHKNPIARYGIDKLTLTNAGIPTQVIDRIFRALFVYSIGFYELMDKWLSHTKGKYKIVTSIWKVFSILLEYSWASDYRMLISELSKQHQDEIEELEK